MPIDTGVQRTVQDDAELKADPRWLLVQRVLASEGFQRASQLRQILLYVSRSAILQQNEVIREYEIACNVLGRRSDFDPANDNIVRAQFTNLRRKLEQYFLEEGQGETLIVSIPKGSYLPIFLPVPPKTQVTEGVASPPAKAEVQADRPGGEEDVLSGPEPLGGRARAHTWRYAAAIVLLALTFPAYFLLRQRFEKKTDSGRNAASNAFVQLLTRSAGDVSVVLPDSSEVILQLVTGAEISAADYSSKDYPQKLIATVKDPEVRYVLTQIGMRRNTTINEAKIGTEFLDALAPAGIHGTVRYARDLHVRDFNEGNTILIGSRLSDPWVSLFTAKMNFQYLRDPSDNTYNYQNMRPLPGEEAHYVVDHKQGNDRENYVDIGFIRNPSQSGYILMLSGTDLESNEAAAHFLLHGHLPPDVEDLFRRKDLVYFELFLRGRHLIGESEDALDVVAVRPK